MKEDGSLATIVAEREAVGAWSEELEEGWHCLVLMLEPELWLMLREKGHEAGVRPEAVAVEAIQARCNG